MGISWAVDRDGWDGDLGQRARVTGTFDTSYTSGGESLTASDAGLSSITEVRVLSPATDSGYVVHYDHDNDDVMLFEASTDGSSLDEVADAANVDGEEAHLEVLGSV